ncbi:MAG: hemerythrin domain-containing protein, partial [Pseudomonadota bacterium]|nr:hemerythrin domain-containing protein [Pseudomonadota bacterium]
MERWILKPGPGFHEPVEMLDACHERMRRHCQTLEKLVTHLGMTGADESARQAAANVIRYFDQSALDHHADEEVNLFPLLRDFASQPKQDVLIQQMDWL